MLWAWSDWAEAEMGGAWFWCCGVGVVCRVGVASWWYGGVVSLGRGLIGRGLDWASRGGVDYSLETDPIGRCQGMGGA